MDGSGNATVVIVMGVAGAGKTTVGRLLAAQLGWEFRDADDLHPPANKSKLHSGIALTDVDRAPWLRAVRSLVESMLGSGARVVVACSALKQSYRDEIAADSALVKFVYLKGSEELLRARLAGRIGHFMNPALLQSQIDTLEEPRDAFVVDVALAPEAIVKEIRAKLRI